MGCCEQFDEKDSIYRGDDTDAFDQEFIVINAVIPEGWVVSKAEWRAGTILKVFTDPVFPIKINLDKTESKKLQNINVCYLAVYDAQGRKQTCQGSLKFISKAEVV